MEIMECPFCGESSENSLIVTDSRRQNSALNKSGKLHKQAVLECVVQCLGCGALGPLSPGFQSKEIDLTEIAELESKNAAILAWNARNPLTEIAFDVAGSVLKATLGAARDYRSGLSIKPDPIIPPIMLSKSNHYFNFVKPDSSTIFIGDIAHSLAHTCRFGGHTREFYSVAQHSVLASYLVPKEDQFAALMHDAAEAFVGDIPKPLKELLPDFQVIEKRVEEAIFERFSVKHPLSASVKQADLVMLATERRDLMPDNDLEWLLIAGIEPMPEPIIPEDPVTARQRFLDRFEELRRYAGESSC